VPHMTGGLCNCVKHRGVNYASWNAENLRPSAMLTSCVYTIDFMTPHMVM
jgi:hypothetical protein